MLVKDVIFNKAKNDDEYRGMLEKRMRLWLFVCAVGAVTLGVGIFTAFGDVRNASFLGGVYCGVGCGLIVANIVRMMKAKKMLRDDRAIRIARLESQDERNTYITQKAMKGATIVAGSVVYLGMLLAVFIDIVIFWTLWSVFILYVITFYAFKLYYKRKM